MRSIFNCGVLGGLLWAFAAHGATLHETAVVPGAAAPLVMSASGAVSVGGGDAMPGVEIGLTSQISALSPLYVGAELGGFLRPGTPTYGLFTLLPTAFVAFETSPGIRPLIGVLAGPVFSTGAGQPAVRFGAFLRPGMNFDLSPTSVLNVEARLGLIGTTLYAIPQAGVMFAI